MQQRRRSHEIQRDIKQPRFRKHVDNLPKAGSNLVDTIRVQKYWMKALRKSPADAENAEHALDQYANRRDFRILLHPWYTPPVP
jgi:hypothetical protein